MVPTRPRGAPMSAADPDPDPPASASPGGLDSVRPVLASEALREELAPIEPLARAARWWCAAIGLGLAGVGLLGPQLLGLHLLGLQAVGPPTSSLSSALRAHVAEIGLGLAAISLGALPLGYVTRARAMVLVSVAVVVAGFFGRSSAIVAHAEPIVASLVHFVAAVALPAALLFRARYPAYAGARGILAVALVLGAPLLGYMALGVGDASPDVQVASSIAVLAMVASVFGFMGSHVRIAGEPLAALIIASLTAESALGSIATASLAPPLAPSQILAIASNGLAHALAAALGTLGVFQLLAARHWEKARAVDVHYVEPSRPSANPSRPSQPESWSMHP